MTLPHLSVVQVLHLGLNNRFVTLKSCSNILRSGKVGVVKFKKINVG